MSKTATVTFVGTDIPDAARQVIYTLSDPLEGHSVVLLPSVMKDPWGGDVTPETCVFPVAGGGLEKSDWAIDWDKELTHGGYDQEALLTELGYELVEA